MPRARTYHSTPDSVLAAAVAAYRANGEVLKAAEDLIQWARESRRG